MTIDPETRDVANRLKTALEARLGVRLAGLYLFGSRARQDHRPDSDLDIAVLVHDPALPLANADSELLDVTYPIEIEHGLHIQAWALPADALTGDGVTSRRRLIDTVRREGIAV
jgi:uncharacterized protein